ncbi:CRISPR-associated protein, Cas1 family [Anaerosphaera aminiphila DSM 21120]|uniref:CRISPR-associated endonuclease Cas1 n=1 Tax=Anaerosphaera aminiphila DSM 21120 TaxID=1120995 RepID=A0A1M5U501_9FIRM|nr:type I-B CRISPR-associated endonuclease Cas1b [Anaerosphaera aminiphila]SHH57941.1 CRISPR-associated protein, Cas1 family [Anaerosphaera aminiphila DSM 21120]
MSNFYIFSNGELIRKDNNISIIVDGEKKDLKSEVIEDIYLFGEVSLNTKLLNFASQKDITIHVFNYYGFYSGSYYPRKTNVGGSLLVEQVKNYLDYENRLYIAKQFISAGSFNIYRNLRYYNSRDVKLDEELKQVDILIKKIEDMDTIQALMGLEGNIRRIYYSTWNKIVKQDIDFQKRVKRPPDNMINTLISYLNSLIYTTTLSEIYKTQLDPTISFLHEPGEKRFSLSLDISEIFKPIIVDRMIFSMLNKAEITEKDFDTGSNFLYLKESARKKIIEKYDKRLATTIKHRDLDRSVSYRYLMRLEAYKLIKHIIREKEYEAFRMWW